MFKNHRIPRANCPNQRQIQDYAGRNVPGTGEHFTSPLLICHNKQFVRVSFEITEVAKEYNAILPQWWLAKHKYKLLANNRRIKLDMEYCKGNCTKHNHENFSRELDPAVLTGKDVGILGIVATALTKDNLQVEINRVPEAFRQFIAIMTTEAAMELPNHRPYIQAIDVNEGETPSWEPIYTINEVELEELSHRLKKMTHMGAVRESKSSCSLPMLSVPKVHSCRLCLCIDDHGINKRTVPNPYPIPNMNELEDRIRAANWFTKIKLKKDYQFICIKKGEEWKTAFRCRYGLFEYTVMPFGLVKDTAIFRSIINHMFHDMQDKGLITFMDDIIIHAETCEKHDEIILEVLKSQLDNHLCIAPDKCGRVKYRVKFLRKIISRQGLKITEEMVQTHKEMKLIKTLKQTKHFLGFANFYHRFIKDYSKSVLPLRYSMALDKKD